ncbi:MULTISPECIES: hypothetical protein [Streptomyces]|uniref:hypothetical protein n=1 Tax=Streptomyces TaxID=1883 RepID=UPI0009962BAF|nr:MULTISPECIES: hypothetical protein [Streptomyces]AQW46766.1 hypothetical protein SHXM_00229 [Streptomyces hygroscopicus]ASQ91971.1 hypothetical protein CGL27_01190 [Streptomyces sp. 11-1-2]
MAPPTPQAQPTRKLAELPEELADAFDLDPTQEDIGRLGGWLGGDEDDEGDTTGDGCGESPPQGPTTGC